MRIPTRKQADDFFPTLVRYVGVGIIVAFVGASFIGVRLPESILVAASGCILYKTVKGGNGNGNGNGGEK